MTHAFAGRLEDSHSMQGIPEKFVPVLLYVGALGYLRLKEMQMVA